MKLQKKLFTSLGILLLGCSSNPQIDLDQDISGLDNGDKLMVVDCLLPAQIRKLGQLGVFATARRPIKTTASECEIRGGEYVAYDRANYATALKIWLPRAKAGDAEAQAYVGEIYEKGLGLMPNYQLAVQWYQKAAQQGNTRAQINLGYLYERGLGVEKDIAKAMQWYQKSSGLEKVNLPYAATIETSSESEMSKEIQFLKTELKNSRNEAKRLSRQLDQIQAKLKQGQKNIVTSNKTLAKSKQLLKKATQESNQPEIIRLKQLIQNKEQEIAAQKLSISELTREYQNKFETLKIRLEETEKRARQYADDLKRHKTAASEAQLKLLEVEAKLARTEKRLLGMKQLANNEAQQVAEQQKSDKKLSDYSGPDEHKDLQNAIAALKEIKQEKNQQQELIDRLKEEKNLYRQSIDNLKNQIGQSMVSSEQMKKLQAELQKQKLAANQSKAKLKQQQEELQSTESRLASLEKNYQELLEIQAMEKQAAEKKAAILLSQKTKQHEQALARFQKSQEKLTQQQKMISQLERERQQYEEKIKQLQQQVKSQKLAEKPKIEIIDPPFVLVRGTPTVTLRSVVKKRDIIGKVTASNDLLSFMVNDRKSEIDEQGLFQTTVNLVDTETPVHVVAIDRNGARASLDFILSLGKAIETKQRISDKTAPVKMVQPWKSLDFGQYYALVIGNNNYKKIPALDTPVNDATVVSNVLKDKYGFKTKLLINASRYQILSELNKLRAKLTEKDNLLIYYAGHGELDKVNMRGHWLPVDADADNTANWISTVAITDILNTMSVKHIMVVSDSCYSGAMTRSSLARIEAGSDSIKKSKWLQAMLKARSRTVLTSGGLKPVMDGGGGKHSVFANAFIRALSQNDTLLEGQSLYRKVSAGIVAIAAEYGIEQVPEYAPIRHAGHESGEFFFVPRNIHSAHQNLSLQFPLLLEREKG